MHTYERLQYADLYAYINICLHTPMHIYAHTSARLHAHTRNSIFINPTVVAQVKHAIN